MTSPTSVGPKVFTIFTLREERDGNPRIHDPARVYPIQPG